MSRLWMVPCALLAALAAVNCFLPAAPAPVVKRPRVEVLIMIDTTGSMGSFVEGAKTKIWTICNQILAGKPMPELKVGLVAFRDRGDDYVTQVHDLREDLDEVYASLKTFVATGGGDTPESVNQALDDAVNKVSWSADRKVQKIIFLVGDAPPHMDYPDDVKYPVTCKKAKERGIIINAIQTGGDMECTRYWKEISELAGGAFVALPADGGIRVASTDYDGRLGDLNKALLKTVIPFGPAAKREKDAKKLELATSLTGEAAADRACWMAKGGRVSSSDLLDSIRAGQVRLVSLRAEELPEDMRRMTPKERADHLDKVSQERTKLLRQAQDLDRQRSEALARQATMNKTGFDNQVLEMIRKQTAKRIRY